MSSSSAASTSGPHQNQPVRSGGASPQDAQAAVVMIHGRGATAESILAMAREFEPPGDGAVHYAAPQAGGHAWYPNSFLAPLAANEPGLSSGLQALADVLRSLTDAGLAPERIVLLGFSQGACLASEFVARHPQRYGGLVALSGGLIGMGEKSDGAAPPDDKRFDYDGALDGTPAFFGCSDRDPHIPLKRVRDSADVFRSLGADVEERLYEGMGHTVNRDELAYVNELLQRLPNAFPDA